MIKERIIPKKEEKWFQKNRLKQKEIKKKILFRHKQESQEKFSN